MRFLKTSLDNKTKKESSRSNNTWPNNLKKYLRKGGATNTIDMKIVLFYRGVQNITLVSNVIYHFFEEGDISKQYHKHHLSLP